MAAPPTLIRGSDVEQLEGERMRSKYWILQGRRPMLAALTVIAIPFIIDGCDRAFLRGELTQNEVALDACRRIAETCRDAVALAHEEATGRPVSINAIRSAGGEFAFRVAARGAHRLGTELFTLHPDRVLPADRVVVVAVSPVAFSDYPHPSVWRCYITNPSHAVGYSDGRVELLSSDRFHEIDLSDFVLMGDWIGSDPLASSDQLASAGIRP